MYFDTGYIMNSICVYILYISLQPAGNWNTTIRNSADENTELIPLCNGNMLYVHTYVGVFLLDISLPVPWECGPAKVSYIYLRTHIWHIWSRASISIKVYLEQPTTWISYFHLDTFYKSKYDIILDRPLRIQLNIRSHLTLL